MPLSRRQALSAGGSALALGAVIGTRAFAAPASPEKSVDPDAALQQLKEGNERFAAGRPLHSDYSAKTAASAEIRNPIAAILSCSDARMPTEIIFDQAPGDLYVLRSAGNVLDQSVMAGLDYAVHFLKVPVILVLGHTDCGVVTLATQLVRMRKELPEPLAGVIKSIETAVITAHARHPRDMAAAAIEENVELAAKRLGKDSTILSEALAASKVRAAGGLFDHATGKVKFL